MSEYQPRLTAPDTGNAFYYADNPFYQSGYGMPNCTCYAYGRFWEISGVKPSLSLGDAERWWSHSDGYHRGQTPRLGAVIVWAKGSSSDGSDGSGHVAIVEQINTDGSIVTSNSAWGGSNFYTKVIPAGYTVSGYTFLGFIYNPVTSGSYGEYITGNRYLTQSEMEVNARFIFYYLYPRGWSLNAIAAMLANFEAESTMNPGLMEGLYTNPQNFYDKYGYYPGYGLAQWTPYTKYTNWCNARGLVADNLETALKRIEWEYENGEQFYSTSSYPISWKAFKTSERDVEWLSYAWMYNYERPASLNQPWRKSDAHKWYKFICGLVGAVPPSQEGKKEKKGLSLLLMYLASKGMK